ncbi:MAG: branched-chain amino acid ABC transporter permease, partial [Actinobacteria bacterium]
MSRTRSSFLAGCRDLLPLVPAGIAFGLVVGVAIAQAGLGAVESVGMSGLVYGASAQLAATVLWRDGAPLFVVVATVLVINARFFIYGASLAPVLGPSRWWHGLVYGYFLRDGIYAATMTRAVPDPAIDPLPYFLGGALVDWGVWIVATVAGTLGASLLPASWSLDFIVPLVFIALLAGAATTR